MNRFIFRLMRLFLGFFLYALGIVLTLNANIGYAPWEVFHVGLASTMGISIGVASIVTGLAIVIIALVLKEKVGIGTILNMIMVGVFVDVVMWFNIIPVTNNFVIGTAMLIAGLFVISLGTYFYIGSEFGAGPRDSLMVAITRKTSLPVGACRSTIELCAVVIGWLLGGMVGVGTVISVIAIGFCIQLTFHLLRFDTTKIQHETLAQTFQAVLRRKDED